jgi:hypothetical protein
MEKELTIFSQNTANEAEKVIAGIEPGSVPALV